MLVSVVLLLHPKAVSVASETATTVSVGKSEFNSTVDLCCANVWACLGVKPLDMTRAVWG